MSYIFIKNYRDKKPGDVVDSSFFDGDDILIYCLLDACILEYVISKEA